MLGCQIYLAVRRCCVASIPGCDMEWNTSCLLEVNRTNERNTPVDVSHAIDGSSNSASGTV